MGVYAVIMAGGRGERLWPASTPERPKPFLPLGGEGRTLLRATYERVLPVVGSENIFVVADSRLISLVQDELGLSESQLIIEPQGRNTAPAIGLAAICLQQHDPEAIMIALPSDHLIMEEERFRQALTIAIEAAGNGYLVTFGITPSYPATGYGYIQRGEALSSGVFRVQRFIEKPDKKRAEHFLSEGGYYWNSGMFVWQTRRILEEIRLYLPKLSAVLEELVHLYGTPLWEARLTELWSQVEAVSIDYGVMEHAKDVVVIPLDVKWSDVGDWRVVWEILPKNVNGVAEVGEHFGKDTSHSLVWAMGGKPVVTLGITGLAIVDTPKALLVVDLDRTQAVRELVQLLEDPNKRVRRDLGEKY